jgi:tetratricopeptide (TPR) repeat protein
MLYAEWGLSLSEISDLPILIECYRLNGRGDFWETWMSQTNAWLLQLQKPGLAAVETKFREASALHERGRLAEAEHLYGEILRQQPDHFDALLRLGVIAAQTGRPERAVELFRKAIKLNGKIPAVHRNLGMALFELKRFRDALASYDRAISLKPDYADCYNSRGLALQELKRPADALIAYDKAITLRPNFVEAYFNRGLVLESVQKPLEAVAAYDKALALRPNFPEAHHRRGRVLETLNQAAEALASYDRVIALKPAFAEAYTDRGNILQEMRLLDEALASHDHALALRPDFAEAYNNRSIALLYLMRPAEALASCDQALALKPDFPQAYNNRGNILHDLRRFEEALAAYDKAIALDPDHVEAYNNRSMLLLLMGRFDAGWPEYEWRKKRRDGPVAATSYPQPLWTGKQDIEGKTIFIWWEQGFGDTIQFCRYAKVLAARGARVIMSVQQPLLALLRSIGPAIEVIDHDATEFDYHCPLMSLPLALGTLVDSIPSGLQYITADEKLRVAWEARLPEKKTPRIGVIWSGSTAHNIYNRSIQLEMFLTLLTLDADWVCLQKELNENDVATLRQDGRIIFFGDDLRDFSDTAALLDLMDLVITIDTSVAHLAGAMGKPVWILLPFNADWRWLLDQNDSPWYPSARLFRQRELGNWMNVIEDVKNAIRTLGSWRHCV